MSSKSSGTSTAIQTALALASWRVIQQLFKLRHIRGTSRTLDLIDENFLTKDKKLKKSVVQAKIPEDAKEIIRKKINEGPKGETDEQQAERIAQTLSNDRTFLSSLSGIFTPSFLRLPEPETPAEEQQPEEEIPQSVPSKDPSPKKKKKEKKREAPPLVESPEESEDEEALKSKAKKALQRIREQKTSQKP
jgi:hypothetical protein